MASSHRPDFSQLHWIIFNLIFLALILIEGIEFIRWKLSSFF